MINQDSVRCDFPCVNVPVHEVVAKGGVLSPQAVDPAVDIGTSNVHELFQKWCHPKRKEKRSKNSGRSVVSSWAGEIYS